MHVGGALAKDVVRSLVPSAFGHGVSPVIFLPSATAVPLAAVVAVEPATVVLESLDTFVLLSSPPRLVSHTTSSTRTTTTPPAISRRWVVRRCWARCNSA